MTSIGRPVGTTQNRRYTALSGNTESGTAPSGVADAGAERVQPSGTITDTEMATSASAQSIDRMEPP